MVKKYKYLLILLMVFLAAGFFIKNGNKTHYGISEGTYRMVTKADSQLQPLIHFYMNGSDIRFVFSADEHISFAYRGRVELDGRVNAHCENGEQRWIFEVVDNDTIRFVQKGSSDFRIGDELLQDGAVFRYAQQK